MNEPSLSEINFMQGLYSFANYLFWLVPVLAFVAIITGLIIWLVNRNPSSPRNSERARKAGKLLFFIAIGVWAVGVFGGWILINGVWNTWKVENCTQIEFDLYVCGSIPVEMT